MSLQAEKSPPRLNEIPNVTNSVLNNRNLDQNSKRQTKTKFNKKKLPLRTLRQRFQSKKQGRKLKFNEFRIDDAKSKSGVKSQPKNEISFRDRWRALKSQKKKSKVNFEFFGSNESCDERVMSINPRIENIELKSQEELPGSEFDSHERVILEAQKEKKRDEKSQNGNRNYLMKSPQLNINSNFFNYEEMQAQQQQFTSIKMISPSEIQPQNVAISNKQFQNLCQFEPYDVQQNFQTMDFQPVHSNVSTQLTPVKGVIFNNINSLNGSNYKYTNNESQDSNTSCFSELSPIKLRQRLSSNNKTRLGKGYFKSSHKHFADLNHKRISVANNTHQRLRLNSMNQNSSIFQNNTGQNTGGQNTPIKSGNDFLDNELACSDENLDNLQMISIYNQHNSQGRGYFRQNQNSNFNNSAFYQNHQSGGKKKIDETKYKTEMCKNWLAVGYCSYGQKCKFAHGRHELATKKQVS